MKFLRLFLACCVLPVWIGNAVADSWAPYADRREVDSLNRFYLVINRKNGPRHDSQWGPVEFLFAERRLGTNRVLPAQSVVETDNFIEYRTLWNPDVSVRNGDTLHGAGELDIAPRHVRISSSGGGFAFVDVYGYNIDLYDRFEKKDQGYALFLFSKQANLLYQLRLSDLFTADELQSFGTTAGDVVWYRESWIDEESKNLVVVGATRKPFEENPNERDRYPIRTVNLRTGMVRNAGGEQIVRALSTKNLVGMRFAIEYAAAKKLESARKPLATVMADASLPRGVRQRAAAALVRWGDRSGRQLVMTAMKEPPPRICVYDCGNYSEWASDREFVVRYLFDIVGQKALPILSAELETGKCSFAASDAFVHIGESAIPTLIEALKHDDVMTRAMAAYALGQIGSPHALPALRSIQDDSSSYVRDYVSRAMQRIRRRSDSKSKQ